MSKLWTRTDKSGLVALALGALMVGLFLLLALTGCTGEQLAPGGNVQFRFNPDPNHPGLSWTSNKDITCDSLELNMQTGTLKVIGLNSNASVLGGLQATASVEQLRYWNLGYSQGVNALLSAMGKAQVQQNATTPLVIAPATSQPSK